MDQGGIKKRRGTTLPLLISYEQFEKPIEIIYSEVEYGEAVLFVIPLILPGRQIESTPHSHEALCYKDTIKSS